MQRDILCYSHDEAKQRVADALAAAEEPLQIDLRRLSGYWLLRLWPSDAEPAVT